MRLSDPGIGFLVDLEEGRSNQYMLLHCYSSDSGER